ncbi:uncharacterized protein ATNIH1004_010553 [Aspergillus tanneri]|uniref:Uncharacterized protein n=1 Tax=Aspergillus tanneri TaxID=1220188 RepID=A0A5M9MH29_9EURO|nr:uncharacterized protein ATNIH1004_010553 [Aspergillus tanneri]KAA8643779.1 hypothetical protein ATNIH1004_010553 [Aspergillus tanneri]
MALRTAHFEKEHQNTLAKTAQILNAEDTRLKRVEYLLVQFENENLRWQLDQVNLDLAKALNGESEARRDFGIACDEIDNLRATSRGLSNEIKSLQLAADNVRLSKELRSMQSEMENLKAQNSSSQAFFLEKKSLERQFHSLELELESEKSAHKRTLARESQQGKEIGALNSLLEEERKRRAEEERTQSHRKLNIHQQGPERAAQEPVLEEKGVLGRNQASAKGRPKATLNGNQWPRHSSNAKDSGNHTTQSRMNFAQQAASHFNPELTIATPGAFNSRDKKKKASALPGDKSSFSITPFLNRTNGPQESPISSDGTDELYTGQADEGTDGSSFNTGLVNNNMDSQPEDQIAPEKLGPQPMVKQPFEPSTPTAGISRKGNHKLFSKTAQEDRTKAAGAVVNNLLTQGQWKSKKRKLGAQREKSLFDGEDEDDELHDVRKPGRRIDSGSTIRGLASSGFREFSPLKRDRKRL